jgi:orc1/cdc6 family replication initiation protein
VITDARALDVEGFVPETIQHRNSELDALSSALSPLLEDCAVRTVHCYGPSGVGKTACARYTLGQLRREMLDVNTQYINCWQHHSRFAALYQLVDGIGRTFDIRQGATVHHELLRRVRDADDHHYVVVLDEVDQLDTPDLLYDLHQLPHVSLVLIANRKRDLFDPLDERPRSRLRPGQRVTFEQYGVDVLVDILAARAEVALEPWAVDRAVLEAIADRAVGDAQVAIRTLREAAELASDGGAGSITPAHVEAALPAAEAVLRDQTLSNLTRHQRVLYEVVDEYGPARMGTVYERYADRVDEPKSRRTVRRYLAKLSQYDLFEKEGEKGGRTYRCLS